MDLMLDTLILTIGSPLMGIIGAAAISLIYLDIRRIEASTASILIGSSFIGYNIQKYGIDVISQVISLGQTEILYGWGLTGLVIIFLNFLPIIAGITGLSIEIIDRKR
jgi:hypothetical protein